MSWINRTHYWEHTAPQDDPDWLRARIFKTTTSTSAGMAGRSTFKTVLEQAAIISGNEEFFDEESIKLMNHGKKFESKARNWYANKTGYNIIERGLCVPHWDFRLGASVDGDIENTDGIIEIKCPSKMYAPLQQYIDQVGIGWKPPKNYYEHIYPSHFDQMQQGMKILGKKWCEYIVYSVSDGAIFTQTIPFNETYWNNHYKIISANYEKYVRPHVNNSNVLPPH